MTEGTKMLRRLAAVLLVLGLIGWFGAFLCCFWLSRVAPADVEFPLAELKAVALDSRGRIYCATMAYARVQVYDQVGRFQRGWYVDAAGGVFAIWSDRKDHIHVMTARNDTHYVFATDGRLLRRERIADPHFTKRSARVRDSSGTTYEVRRPSIWPQVVKIDPSGNESVIVSPRLDLWWVSGPFPAWIFVAAGILLFGAADKLVRPGSREESGEHSTG